MLHKLSNLALLKELLKSVPDDDSCMKWPRSKTASFGYGTLKINYVSKAVHRVAYELVVGAIPDGLCVLHKCDNPPCFRPSHLFIGTKLDNMADCRAKGRNNKSRGSAVNTSKLNEEQVRQIRRDYASGDTQVVIAARFSIRQTSVSRIVLGRHWKHVSA